MQWNVRKMFSPYVSTTTTVFVDFDMELVNDLKHFKIEIVPGMNKFQHELVSRFVICKSLNLEFTLVDNV